MAFTPRDKKDILTSISKLKGCFSSGQELSNELLQDAVDSLQAGSSNFEPVTLSSDGGATLEDGFRSIEVIGGIPTVVLTLADGTDATTTHEIIGAVGSEPIDYTPQFSNVLTELQNILTELDNDPDYTADISTIITNLSSILTELSSNPDYTAQLNDILVELGNDPNYTTALNDILTAIGSIVDYTAILNSIVTLLTSSESILIQVRDAVPTIVDYTTQLADILSAVNSNGVTLSDILSAIPTVVDYTTVLNNILSQSSANGTTLADILSALPVPIDYTTVLNDILTQVSIQVNEGITPTTLYGDNGQYTGYVVLSQNGDFERIVVLSGSTPSDLADSNNARSYALYDANLTVVLTTGSHTIPAGVSQWSILPVDTAQVDIDGVVLPAGVGRSSPSESHYVLGTGIVVNHVSGEIVIAYDTAR